MPIRLFAATLLAACCTSFAVADDGDAPPHAKPKAQILLHNHGIAINKIDGKTNSRLPAPSEGVLIRCKRFQMQGGVESDEEENELELLCEDVEITLPGQQFQGSAAELAYNAARKKLGLRGTKDNPVRLHRRAGGEKTVLTAEAVEISLDSFQLRAEGVATIDMKLEKRSAFRPTPTPVYSDPAPPFSAPPKPLEKRKPVPFSYPPQPVPDYSLPQSVPAEPSATEPAPPKPALDPQ